MVRNTDNGRNSVRGPTSALSSFLQERGITARGNRFARRAEPEAEAATVADNAEVQAEPERHESAGTVDATVTLQPTETVQLEPPKKKKKKEQKKESEEPQNPLPKKNVDVCQRCKTRFVLKKSSLCTECLNFSTMQNATKAKKVTKKRKTGNGGGANGPAVSKGITLTSDSVPLLSELCVELLGKYIEYVESLGELSDNMRQQLAVVLSKHRKITPSVVRLLSSTDNTSLELFDISAFKDDDYPQISAFNPYLQKLVLKECGQLNELSWLNVLPLKSLFLSGSFLIKDAVMAECIDQLPALEEFGLEYSYKISTKTLNALCAKKLTILKFNHVNLTPGIFENNKLPATLEELCLSNCNVDESILKAIEGLNLRSLDLSGNPKLTDNILSSLVDFSELSISNLPELTQEAVNSIKNLPLSKLDISRNPQFTILSELPAVDHLNVNGCCYISKAELMSYLLRANLKTLDVSWCSCVDDELLELFHGTELSLWGCMRVTMYQLNEMKKKGVKVHGSPHI
jgi:DNA repair protein RAD7